METIRDGITGLFFGRQTTEDLGEAIERLERQEWNPQTLRSHAEDFSVPVFRDRFRSFLERIGALPRGQAKSLVGVAP
jgi:hypothetical protein